MAETKTTLEKFKEVVGDKMDALKQLFEIPAAPVTPVEPEQTFVDVKTVDGVVVRIDGGTKEGSKCTVISAEGETPAEGEYALEDGTMFTAKAGIIESVKPKEEEKPAADPNKMDAELAEVKNTVKSITYKYAEMEKAYNEKFEAVAKENEKLAAQNKAMFEVIEKLAGLPVDEATQKPKEVTKVGALAEFRSSVKELKAERRNLRN